MKLVYLTHCHFDHILGAKWLSEKYNAPIGCIDKEKDNVNDENVNLSLVMLGEKFTIECDKVLFENDEIEIAVIHSDDKFQIAVHDNGIGIDPKYHGKIFAKFVQLDSAYTKKESSTGLGLTITKELVELHGGKISLISEINNGSTFIVEIPI